MAGWRGLFEDTACKMSESESCRNGNCRGGERSRSMEMVLLAGAHTRGANVECDERVIYSCHTYTEWHIMIVILVDWSWYCKGKCTLSF